METAATRWDEMLRSCEVCPRRCGTDRLADERGCCGVGRLACVASWGPHFGEEPPLVGRGGSGTVFFAGCNLACQFCQNADISQGRLGRDTLPEELADILLALEARGCCNVNFVSPSHVVPQAASALELARKRGLSVPAVYNSGGYDSVETLRRIEGLFEIYMPDAKYWNPAIAERLSGARDYPQAMRAALLEMHRQVGDLEIDAGVARRGLLVRHLVLPGQTDQSLAIVDFLADEVSPNTYLNVMAQYRPMYRAERHPDIARPPSQNEWLTVADRARQRGLRLCRG